MSDQLYHAALLALAKEVPGKGRLDPADASLRLDNPLCGDRVRLDLRMSGPRVADLAHEVRGCVLCQAAAGVVGRRAVGLDRAGAAALLAEVDRMLAGDGPAAGDLAAFAPVVRHPSRHDCVRLPFQALLKGLGGS